MKWSLTQVKRRAVRKIVRAWTAPTVAGRNARPPTACEAAPIRVPPDADANRLRDIAARLAGESGASPAPSLALRVLELECLQSELRRLTGRASDDAWEP